MPRTSRPFTMQSKALDMVWCAMKSALFLMSALVACQFTHADETKAAMRVLRDECISCHKPGKAKGGLLLQNVADYFWKLPHAMRVVYEVLG